MTRSEALEAMARGIWSVYHSETNWAEYMAWYLDGKPDPDSCVHHSTIAAALARAQAALQALEGVVGPLLFEDQGSARDHAPSTEKASVASDLIGLELRCIRDAAKNGEPILAKFRDDIYPTMRPSREDLKRWNGRWAVIHHNGLAPDGFDIGWIMSAPVGSGGFPDEWIEGWTPLPTPNPQSSGAEG